MRTTIDMSDSLFKSLKEIANREHSTIKALIERAVHALVAESKLSANKIPQLRNCSIEGSGLTPEFQGASWQEIRDETYRLSNHKDS